MLQLDRKAQKGNDKAFLTLIEKYGTGLYWMAYVYQKDQAGALDVV